MLTEFVNGKAARELKIPNITVVKLLYTFIKTYKIVNPQIDPAEVHGKFYKKNKTTTDLELDDAEKTPVYIVDRMKIISDRHFNFDVLYGFDNFLIVEVIETSKLKKEIIIDNTENFLIRKK